MSDFIGGNLAHDAAIYIRDFHHFDAPECESGRRPESTLLGYFDGDCTKNAENPAVLVVHYDFERFFKMKREGNHVDVSNLKETFEQQRGCAFKDLKAPTRDELLEFLGNNDKIKNFRHEGENQGDPSIFILIVLSHGDKGGKILTDYPLDTNDQSGRLLNNNDFISFTTIEIVEQLKTVECLKNSLKLIFFGPCRGENLDTPDRLNPVEDKNNSCRMYSQPNMRDFVVFFSTIESTLSNRDLNFGTWMVQVLCNELKKMRKDLELEVFLTKMLNSIHTQTSFQGNGQTPEIKILPHRKFTFLKMENVDPSSSPTDGKGDTTHVNNNLDHLDFYSWKDKNETPLSRGQALVFFKAKHEKFEEMESALTSLAFTTTSMTMQNMDSVITNVNQGVCDSGCIVVCVFGAISKRIDPTDIYEELMVDVGAEAPVPIQSITSLFAAPKCSKWIGKPKLFFFLDPCQSFDAGSSNSQASGFDYSNVGTKHSGLFVFVGIGPEIIDKLIGMLRDPNVKNGKSIQEVIGDIMRSASESSSLILPQLFSTLQFLVDFQDLENTFIPLSMQRIPLEQDGALIVNLSYNDFQKSLIEFDFEPMDVSCSVYDGNEELVGPRPKMPRLRSRKFENKVSLLSGPPGIGKTLLCKQMSKWVRANFPQYLEFYIHFLQKSDYFSETEWDQVDAIEFLKTEKSGLTEELLHEKIAKNQVVIFLDAFEKICPHYTEPAKILLRQLLDLNLPVWVTTRPEEQHTVREALSCSRLHMLQINNLEESDQLQLLKVKLKTSSEKSMELLHFFKSTGAADFIKNPYYLSLVADFYKKNDFQMRNLFSCFEHIIDFKIKDVLVNKEGADANNKQFSGKFRQLKGLLVKMIVNYLAKNNFADFSEYEIARFNSVGIATINLEKQIKMVHEYFASCLATLEFLNRVRKAKVMGDEGPILIAPKKYLIDPEFKDVRLFIDSFLSNKEDVATLDKFKSPKFITLSNLNEPEVAQIVLGVIKNEGLENLYEFILEIAQDPDVDATIKSSIWMHKVPIK